jgi:hypothetical protein
MDELKLGPPKIKNSQTGKRQKKNRTLEKSQGAA